MDTFIRRRMMFGVKEPPPIPEGNIPYIRNTDVSSYIDTGITADNTTRVVVWARNWNSSGSDNNSLFGAKDAVEADTGFYLMQGNGAHTAHMYPMFGGDTNTDYVTNAQKYIGSYHKYELSSSGFFIDDNLIRSISGGTFSDESTIHLFGYNNNGTHRNSALPIDICACKIYKNDVLVRDYTAVRTPVIGLYDAVTDTVFTNAGSGKKFFFSSFDPNAYTRLTYITTGGSSAVLTSIIGSYKVPIVSIVYPTGTEAKWYDTVSGRTDSDRCQLFFGNASSYLYRTYGIIGTGEASSMNSGVTAGYFRNKLVTLLKVNNTFSTYYNSAQVGNTISFSVGTNYVTNARLAIGASWYEHLSQFGNSFVGRCYYFRIGDSNFIPVLVNDVAGLYDTYHDVFYPSVTETPFTAGPVA